MLSEVLRTTLGEFGARLQAFAPNLLAMLVILLTGALVAGAVPSTFFFKSLARLRRRGRK